MSADGAERRDRLEDDVDERRAPAPGPRAQRDAEHDGESEQGDATAPVDDDCGMRRPNASVERRPRAVETIATSSTPNVLTLMPPAVEPDAPPMNIRAIATNSAGLG